MTILTYDEVADALTQIRAGYVANPFPDWPAVPPRKDAYPQSTVPIAVPASDNADTLEIAVLSWGYPVSWQPAPVFNTRIESILNGNRLWSAGSGNRRCLIPTIRFYERHDSQTMRSEKTGRLVHPQYAFHLVDEPLTWLAGIYNEDHFSVVTTNPNTDVAPIHKRMPIVLHQSELPLWLGDTYHTLADRAATSLHVNPEQDLSMENPPQQLSLF